MAPKACKKCTPLVQEKEEELGRVRVQLTSTQGDISSLRDETSKQKAELERDEKVRQQLEDKIAKAQGLDQQRVGELDSWKSEYKALADANSEAASASGAADQEMHRLKSEKLEVSRELDDKIGEVKVLQRRLAERDAEIESLNEADAANRRTIETLHGNVTALRGGILEIESERDDVREEEQAVKVQLQKGRHQLSESESEIARLRIDLSSAIDDAGAANRLAKDNHARDRAFIMQLRSELAEKDAALQRRSVQLEEATAGERRLNRVMREGAMLSRPNMLDPNMVAELSLVRLQREGEAIAKRGLELGVARNLNIGKTKAEPPTVSVFTDSLSMELAKWQ